MAANQESGLLRCLQAAVPPDLAAVLAAFDLDDALRIAAELAAIGTCELGFRPTGSAAAAEAADYLATEMRRAGLEHIERHRFAVDGWTFAGARVEVLGAGDEAALSFAASSLGGAAGTPAAGIVGDLVWAGAGAAADLAGAGVAGRIALVGMEHERLAWPGIMIDQVRSAGAAAVVMYNVDGYAQAPGALYACDLQGPDDLPLAVVARRDGERLRALSAGGVRVRLCSTAARLPGAVGQNLVGYIRGSTAADELVIIGDHYDAWFQGFLDDAVGVAACLGLARAIVRSGYRPRRTLAFVLHDAEEYGRAGTPFAWCTGAHYQIKRLRPDWAGRTAAAIIFELAGFHAAPELLWSVSPDLLRPAAAVQQGLKATAHYPDGARVEPVPLTWTDAWSYAAAGIPAAANLENPPAFATHFYHTQFDSPALFDAGRYALHAAGLGLLALTVDRDPLVPSDLGLHARLLAAALDGPVRAAAPAAAARLQERLHALSRMGEQVDRLRARLGDPAAARGAAAEAAVARCNARLLQAGAVLAGALLWVEGETQDDTAYPFVQPARDRLALLQAAAALQQGDGPAAAAAVAQVAGMTWGRHVDHAVYRRRLLRPLDEPDGPWFWAAGRIAPYADVWHEYRAAVQGGRADAERYRSECRALRQKAAAAARQVDAALAATDAAVVAALNCLHDEPLLS